MINASCSNGAVLPLLVGITKPVAISHEEKPEILGYDEIRQIPVEAGVVGTRSLKMHSTRVPSYNGSIFLGWKTQSDNKNEMDDTKYVN